MDNVICFKNTPVDNRSESFIDANILATLDVLALGMGIQFTAEDDLVDMGRMFYDYVNTNNQAIGMTWDIFVSTFKESVKLKGEKVYVGGNIIDVIKGFFDNTFSGQNDIFISSIPINSYLPLSFVSTKSYTFDVPGMYFRNVSSYKYDFVRLTNTHDKYIVLEFIKDDFINEITTIEVDSLQSVPFGFSSTSNNVDYHLSLDNERITKHDFLRFSSSVGTFPYSGGYEWDNSKEEEGNYPVYVPGNLGDLTTGNKDNVWDGGWTGGNVNTGNPGVTVPGVDNPSIGVGGENTFPQDIPEKNTFAFLGVLKITRVYVGDVCITNTSTGLQN